MLGNSLRILQANLNRSPTATESTLQVAIELSIDIIVAQEPWLVGHSTSPANYSSARSISHPSFIQILPLLPSPASRPRVLLYISRSFHAQVSPILDFSPPDPDILAVTVKNKDFSFTLLNLYNEKDQRGTGRSTLQRALLSNTAPSGCLLLGDFNTHHHW
jgi:hypothetical protein